VDWILHADLATDDDLDAVAQAGMPIIPTMTFLARGVEHGLEFGRSQHAVDAMKRHLDGAVHVLERARALGIKLMCGTDSGNSPLMPYGELHAKEMEILVRYGGYTPLEAISAGTRDTAFAVGLEDEVGVLEAGKLADLILVTADPLADIRVLQGGRHLAAVIKDGRRVNLHVQTPETAPLALQPATA
jgi:imidazolonepropionase-like amidohydrolase